MVTEVALALTEVKTLEALLFPGKGPRLGDCASLFPELYAVLESL